ncbi:hypothetical protein CA600_29245 [Paenibacillus sp. VTT E-133280]|uniref:hypothetical protein n=1 Tax=Paenibacillus sp. VTT E-133280 TaxID=1986222 RepID=UPI000BA0DBF9|nr:hypothetical protein [Paenibacillus sp. VTT E-133280]OZQ59778.1 hypothetical protein CA600_29245 [Paenibacillus sp. VTT E-133280]
MFKKNWINVGLLLIIIFLLQPTDVYGKAEISVNEYTKINFSFYGDVEKNLIIPRVIVSTIDRFTGEGKEELYSFEEKAFPPPVGYNIDDEYGGSKGKTGRYEFTFGLSNRSYNLNSGLAFKAYGSYNDIFTKVEYAEDYTSFHNEGTARTKLYAFDLASKTLTLLKEGTATSDIREVFIEADLYTISDRLLKQTQIFTLSKNTYVTSVPFTTEYINSTTIKNDFNCMHNEDCFLPTAGTSISNNLVIYKNGKYYELGENSSMIEIKADKHNWSDYHWRIVVNNHRFEERRIKGFDRITTTDANGKVTVISTPKASPRGVFISPNHKFLVLFEHQWIDKNGESVSGDYQLILYDIEKQKKVRTIKLPYKLDVNSYEVKWYSNTVIEYVPFVSSNQYDFRNIQIDLMTGIMTRDLHSYNNSYSFKYINANYNAQGFTFVRPLEILYKDKQIIYTKQPSFEGANGLVYCSVKDLAHGLGAVIKAESGRIKLTLNGKTATVDLSDEQVIMYDGTAYAPIKSIVIKLGLQYKRESHYSTRILLE